MLKVQLHTISAFYFEDLLNKMFNADSEFNSNPKRKHLYFFEQYSVLHISSKLCLFLTFQDFGMYVHIFR